MTDVRFIYKPKSGDRVLAHREHADVLVHRWSNGCRHVIGGVLITIPSADESRWWRDTAQALAASIIEASGGIAWDENGLVSLVVPTPAAYPALQAMLAGAPSAADRVHIENINAGGLVLAGVARIELSPSGWTLAPTHQGIDRPVAVISAQTVGARHEIVHRVGDAEAVIAVPTDWL